MSRYKGQLLGGRSAKQFGQCPPNHPRKKTFIFIGGVPFGKYKIFQWTVQRQIISKSLQSCRFLALLGIAVTTVKIAFVGPRYALSNDPVGWIPQYWPHPRDFHISTKVIDWYSFDKISLSALRKSHILI